MKKQFIKRVLLGIPLGIAIGYVISIGCSIVAREGVYIACMPQFAMQMGSELNGVIVQTLLMALIGAGFSGASFIWDVESWSLMKQTAAYFLITALVIMPAAWFLYWIEHSWLGLLEYFLLYVLLFILFWLISYLLIRRKIRALNSSLKSNRKQ